MLQSLRHRRLFLLRLLMLALVGFGVFGTSLASALTDIHMLSHADIGADVHEHDDAALAKAPDAEDAANALLHALVPWCTAWTATAMAACCRPWRRRGRCRSRRCSPHRWRRCRSAPRSRPRACSVPR